MGKTEPRTYLSRPKLRDANCQRKEEKDTKWRRAGERKWTRKEENCVDGKVVKRRGHNCAAGASPSPTAALPAPSSIGRSTGRAAQRRRRRRSCGGDRRRKLPQKLINKRSSSEFFFQFRRENVLFFQTDIQSLKHIQSQHI